MNPNGDGAGAGVEEGVAAGVEGVGLTGGGELGEDVPVFILIVQPRNVESQPPEANDTVSVVSLVFFGLGRNATL
jgi:hypothetical protein